MITAAALVAILSAAIGLAAAATSAAGRRADPHHGSGPGRSAVL